MSNRLTRADQRAALQAIIDSDKPYVTPAMAAPLLGCDPYLINLTVKRDYERYGENITYPFRVELRGTRVIINRREFIEHFARDLMDTPQPPATLMFTPLPDDNMEALARRVAGLLFQMQNGGEIA